MSKEFFKQKLSESTRSTIKAVLVQICENQTQLYPETTTEAQKKMDLERILITKNGFK